MYTKSLIQQHIENLHIKESFNDGLSSLMEKYNIKDNIFVINNGVVKEVTKGYFIIEKECDNLDEAIRECDIRNMGIRIINNKIFQVGNIYTNLSQCPKESSIFDINTLNNVR